MIEVSCDLCGTGLLVRADSESQLAPLLPMIAPLQARLPAGPAFHLTIRSGHPGLPPDGSDLLAEGPLPEGVHGVLTRRGEALRLAIGDRVAISWSKAEGTIVAAPGSEALIGFTCGINAIDAALTFGGQQLLHAAALTMPNGGAFLLFAPSGAGKTTTALGLAQAGFAILTDDTAVAKPMNGAYAVWALPRPLKVHRRTVELLPWLTPLMGSHWDGNNEQSLPLAAISQSQLPTGQPHRLSAVVQLGPRAPGKSSLTAMPKPDALIALATDNLRSTFLGVQESERGRLAMLSAMLSAVPTLACRVGDLAEIGALFAAGLPATSKGGVG